MTPGDKGKLTKLINAAHKRMMAVHRKHGSGHPSERYYTGFKHGLEAARKELS